MYTDLYIMLARKACGVSKWGKLTCKRGKIDAAYKVRIQIGMYVGRVSGRVSKQGMQSR